MLVTNLPNLRNDAPNKLRYNIYLYRDDYKNSVHITNIDDQSWEAEGFYNNERYPKQTVKCNSKNIIDINELIYKILDIKNLCKAPTWGGKRTSDEMEKCKNQGGPIEAIYIGS